MDNLDSAFYDLERKSIKQALKEEKRQLQEIKEKYNRSILVIKVLSTIIILLVVAVILK